MNKASSLYLDLVRLAAALVVFIVHAHYLLSGGMPGLWWLAGLGGEAVTVFFVLSGFVIAHVVRTRELQAADYFAARFARLYSVVLPALLVTVVLDLAGAAMAPAAYPAPTEGGTLGVAASMLFINELWFNAFRPMSNTPFWSLGYEFWYYVIYGAARYLPGRGARWGAVLLLCCACGPKILLLMPVWLLGVAACVFARRVPLRLPPAALLAAASAAGMVLLVVSGAKAEWRTFTIAVLGPEAVRLGPSSHVLYTYAFGLLATAHLVAMMALAPLLGRAWDAGERVVRTTSAQTFAIYLFHYPILQFFVAATASAGLGRLRAPLVIAVTLGVIALLGRACDRWKPVFKRWFASPLQAMFPPARLTPPST